MPPKLDARAHVASSFSALTPTCSLVNMASRIPSRSRSSKQDVPPSSAPAGSTRLALSTPPELLSWLVDELGYVPAPSGSAARLPLAGTHWTLATEGKELKLSDLTRSVSNIRDIQA